MRPDEMHTAARRKVRCRPTWWLRRREQRIVAGGNPTKVELVELGTIRRVLKVRTIRPIPRWRVMGGAVEIRRRDGIWTVAVNGGKRRIVGSLTEALEHAGTVTFAPGESPGSWRVAIIDP